MKILPPMKWDEFLKQVSDDTVQTLGTFDFKWIAHPGGLTVSQLLENVSSNSSILVAIGPEGGLTEKEEDDLNKLGFISTSLGNRIMRVETVPMFVLSIINYEFME